MKSFHRTDRLAAQIKRELSEILLKFEESPATGIISITEVELSKNLRLGKVFFSVLGDESAKNMAEIFFETHGKELRRRLGSRIRVRFLPELNFNYDNSIERGMRINELLEKIKDEERHV